MILNREDEDGEAKETEETLRREAAHRKTSGVLDQLSLLQKNES